MPPGWSGSWIGRFFDIFLKKTKKKIWWVKKNVYLCIPFRKGGKQKQSSLTMAPAANTEKLSVLSGGTLEERKQFIDNTERDNEVKKRL